MKLLKITQNLSMPLFAALALSACGSSSGDGLSAPAVTPPMEAALPTALKSAANLNAARAKVRSLNATTTQITTCSATGEPSDTTGFTDAEKLASNIYCRLFAKGPIQVLTLTEGVDDRLAELETRTEEERPACMDADLVDKSGDFVFPGQRSEAFTQKLQCREAISDSQVLSFGNDGNDWWVLESQQNSGASATSQGLSQAWKITTDDGGDVLTEEGYITMSPLVNSGSLAGSTVLMHAYVDTAAATVELTGAGENIGFCAFHLKTNSTHIYVAGQLISTGGACGSTTTACLSATTYEPLADSECTTLSSGLALTSLNRSAYSAASLLASTLSANGTASSDMSTWNNFCPTTVDGVDDMFE